MTSLRVRNSIDRLSSTRSFSTTAAALPEVMVWPGVDGAVTRRPPIGARAVKTKVVITALRDTRPRRCGSSAKAGAAARMTMTATHTGQRESQAITVAAPALAGMMATSIFRGPKACQQTPAFPAAASPFAAIAVPAACARSATRSGQSPIVQAYGQSTRPRVNCFTGQVTTMSVSVIASTTHG